MNQRANQSEQREMVVDGKRLETAWLPAQTGGKPTLVMLHEGLGSIRMWKDFPIHLAEGTGCGILLYSRHGHGGSERLAEKRSGDYLEHEGTVVLPSVLQQAGIRNPVLIGHSDGASIALIYAGTHADSPRGLILEAPHVFVEDFAIAGITRTTETYRTTDLPRKLGRYHQDGDATFWGWSDIWLDPAFRSWNIESYLPGIRCPVLMIQGEDDEYTTAAQLDAIQAVVKAERLMLPRCGHSPHRDQGEICLERMAEFIRTLA